MRFFTYQTLSGPALALCQNNQYRPLIDLYGWEQTIAALHDGAKPETGQALAPDMLQPALPATVRSKILCVGVNYRDHASEGNMPMPEFPNFFIRYLSSLVPQDAALILPKVSSNYDYEAELVIVIGKTARHVSKEQALSYVFGYTLGMDGSVRDYQKRTSQFTLGKNFDKSGALGALIVTTDELPAGAKGLSVQSRLNSELLQDGNTADMVFDTAAIVSSLSECMTLNPGDLIFTGTPSGVGFARKPPLFMKAGDTLEVSVGQIGALRNKVEAEA